MGEKKFVKIISKQENSKTCYEFLYDRYTLKRGEKEGTIPTQLLKKYLFFSYGNFYWNWGTGFFYESEVFK